MAGQRIPPHLFVPVSSVARRDMAVLREDCTVQQTLDSIRSQGIGERIVYFYVVNSKDRLVGVIPTRRLLAAPLEQRIGEIMIGRVVSIPKDATLLDAHEILVRTKLLALPVVDGEGHIEGVVDVGMFAERDFDALDRQKTGEVFELIGFRVSQVRNASVLRVFKFRFPWLLATVASGTLCAVLAGAYDVTLARSLVLAFFLTLVLGLGESVSIQSMTVTIHVLRFTRPTLKWYLQALRRELATACLLGGGCAILVGLVVCLWHGAGPAALVISGSILLVILASAFWGLTVPASLHILRLDPKIAAGPVTLALADLGTIVIYFSVAAMLL
ncbi:MAG TPA: magnesium transporter [Phycisphaerales bacterium]|nr:magnesium transporter [Phycisphaerales bacterium]